MHRFIPINKTNVTLLNTVYSKPAKKEDGKYHDSITLVYKDNDTGIKHRIYLEDPLYEYFMLKEGEPVPKYNMLFVEMDRVDPIIVPYKDLEKDIAIRTDNLEFFYDNVKSNNRYENKMLHTCTNVFKSDLHIEDFYRMKFIEECGLCDANITKTYLDIEADTKDMRGDFPELGECPVNAVTIIDGTSDKVFTLALRNNTNPLIDQFEDKLRNRPKEFFDKLNETMEFALRGKKNIIRYGIDKLKYDIHLFDSELELIDAVFKIINSTNPDFTLAYNMSFDIPYLIERLKVLGVDPATVVCHPDFEDQICYYYVDERNGSDFAERGDFATISAYTTYLDQLIHFAGRRKGQKLEIKSFKLDDVGFAIAGVRKLSFSHITTVFAEFPYKDFELFIIYNIIDTLVQKCIEIKTDDIGFAFNKSLMNSCRYQKCHRNTIYLKLRGALEFAKDGLIMGNNANIKTPKESYPGGLVANPKLNEPNGIKINGVPTMIRRNVVDYDFKSLYPSINREFNLSPNTMIAKIVIENQIHKWENMFDNADYDRGGQFLEDMISRNYLIIGSRWLSLAGYKDLLHDVAEYIDSQYENRLYRDGNGNKFPVTIRLKNNKLTPVTIRTTVNIPVTVHKKHPKVG